MNNNIITDWVKFELYPSLFERIDQALPEHSFKRCREGWRSSTYLSGAPHKRADKTVVTTKAPGIILEQGGKAMSLVDYVMERDRVEFIQAVKTLSAIAGVSIPKSPDYNPEAYRKYRDQANIMEEGNSYFIYCIEHSEGAEEVRAYLGSRGYSEEDIKAMELGYIPSQDKLFKYLQGKGYKTAQIDEAVGIKTDTRIGSSHRLTIPYRSGGTMKGFKIRTIGSSVPKYLNTSGLDKSGGLFNLSALKGDKDLIIVEGELDALHATAKGLDNVVALGGGSISPEQIRDAKKRGARSFTLCLDRERGKEAETLKRINSATEVILGEGVNRVYIVTLPEPEGDKTDPDRLIKESGIGALKEAIAGAQVWYTYRLQAILHKYGAIQDQRGLLDKDIDSLLDEVVETATRIKEPTDKDLYIKLFTSQDAVKGLGITEESLTITIDRLRATKERETQATELRVLLSKAMDLQAKGETEEALELMDKGVKEVRIKAKEEYITQLREIPTEEAIKEFFSKDPGGILSGYSIGEEEIVLPSGGLTGIAGATNHGKTDLLVNMALNAVKRYPEKEFYFFTYEMSQEAILVRFLNTYLDTDLQSHSNQRAIKHYFKTGSTQFIRGEVREYFLSKTEEFFRDIIGSGRLRVKGVDFTSPELNMALEELTKRGNIGGYFIDYFQLLRLPKDGYKNYSRQEELKIICQDLNTTAKKLQLPIILGAQFNREVTTPFRLHATNIGEAGDIERILDTLIGIWYTNKAIVSKDLTKADQAEISKRELDIKDRLYFYILKSRETATDTWTLLGYDGKRGVIKTPGKYF